MKTITLLAAAALSFGICNAQAATLNGTLNGALNGSLNGTLNGSFNGTINGSLNGSLNGSMNGTMNGSINGAINGIQTAGNSQQAHSSYDPSPVAITRVRLADGTTLSLSPAVSK